ncbi:MAG: tetratricopeptide repeat protein [Pseudomonadota bacterium]|nr:tetratricopeptide repeat protein [Pseudomonadota bacterium]
MSNVIKREDSAIILKKIDECRLHLKKENIYSCLLCFKTALQMTLKTKMLPSDEREIMKAVNEFQKDLSSSPAFCAFYGPVSFHDDAVKTSLDFVAQLIMINEEELREKMGPAGAPASGERPMAKEAAKGVALPEPPDNDDRRRASLVREAGLLLDQGEYGKAKDLLGDDEESISMLLQIANNLGIQYRKSGKFDRAISEFRKALALYPDDEGLHYNIARVYVEKREWAAAEEAILRGISINPEFHEGKNLLKYIRSNARD